LDRSVVGALDEIAEPERDAVDHRGVEAAVFTHRPRDLDRRLDGRPFVAPPVIRMIRFMFFLLSLPRAPPAVRALFKTPRCPSPTAKASTKNQASRDRATERGLRFLPYTARPRRWTGTR